MNDSYYLLKGIVERDILLEIPQIRSCVCIIFSLLFPLIISHANAKIADGESFKVLVRIALPSDEERSEAKKEDEGGEGQVKVASLVNSAVVTSRLLNSGTQCVGSYVIYATTTEDEQ